MHIYTTISPGEARKKAATYLNSLFAENTSTPLLLLTSGGSALDLLDEVDITHLGSHTTIAMLDDRYSTSQNINNFMTLQKKDFYGVALTLNLNFIESNVQNEETQDELAKRFEASLRDWHRANPKGRVIATLGIGEDAHTAGIMPYPKDKSFFDKTFINTDSWVVAYDAGKKSKYSKRVTTTIEYIRKHIGSAVAYVSGPRKKEGLQKAINSKSSLHEAPAAVIQKMKSIRLFTDIKL